MKDTMDTPEGAEREPALEQALPCHELRFDIYDAYDGVFHIAVIPMALIEKVVSSEAYRRIVDHLTWRLKNDIPYDATPLYYDTKRDGSWAPLCGLLRPDKFEPPSGAAEAGWQIIPYVPKRAGKSKKRAGRKPSAPISDPLA